MLIMKTKTTLCSRTPEVLIIAKGRSFTHKSQGYVGDLLWFSWFSSYFMRPRDSSFEARAEELADFFGGIFT